MNLRTLPGYVEAVQAFDAMLKRYAVSGWGMRKMDHRVFADLVERGRGRLMSASAPARIAFVTAAARRIESVSRVTRARQAFFVTLTPTIAVKRAGEVGRVRFKRGRDGAVDRNIEPEQPWGDVRDFARRELFGFDYFGIVEIAFYGTHPTARTDGPVLCYHAHLVVWNATREQLNTIAARVNCGGRSMLPEVAPMHVVALNSGERVLGSIIYALKPPLKEYRAFTANDDSLLMKVWQQRKRPMRPGDASLVARALTGVEIDQLCIEAGQGRGLTAEIAAAARRQLRRDERRLRRSLEAARG